MLCECGCGQDAGVYSATDRRRGKPKRFINGHFSKGKSRKTHCVRGHLRTPESIHTGSFTCKLCHADSTSKTKLWAKTPTGKTSIKNTDIKLRYGITLQEHDVLLKKQKGLCEICSSKLDSSSRNLIPQVDHVHMTNEPRYSSKIVRGLLCGLCNRGLGQFKDSLELLEKAVHYLKETQ
jgi:Recombination endonuclease VII